ncbi:helix-turn-helix domain-containing protein [Halioglobus sp. HI00S01]|uniref:helix-turn-helix domain-containing protein n=1 Tax=Halioglobus sp. HI00S01 TaxID=1822214 RepID=UPI001E3AFC31|nr:AraC family transcriptional regulator [Halioglobus sp. HI00S01]
MEHALTSRAGAGSGYLPDVKALIGNPLLAPMPPQPVAPPEPDASEGFLPRERPSHQICTAERVLKILLESNLARVRADSVAETLGMSGTTLRRRLRQDHTCYQFLLDRVRQYRCERSLRDRWRPGKCLADELGYLEVNSFYRAFQRWTGLTYSQYREQSGY